MTEIKIGRYEIRDELGEGGMGTVYLAYDPTLGREVALKVLHPHLFSHDPAFSLRFEQEARTIAALEHSHIVPLYEFGEDSNGLYFVMRLMKGGTLRDKLTQGLLTLEETIAILERIGSALDKAHRSGIIHRDLKPGNILFDEDGNTFLGDFGIVKTEDADRLKTRTGQSLGTPHYMSPEQVDGKELDGRSDIYALGVIFYEMVTGDRPYDHPTSTVRVMAMHLAAPIPSLLEANPDLPAQLEVVLQKAMAKAPADRYNTAHEMVTAIKAATMATAPTQILSEPEVSTIPSHAGNSQLESTTVTDSEPTPVPRAEIEPQKANPMTVGSSILGKARNLRGSLVLGRLKLEEEAQKTYWKAMGRTLLKLWEIFSGLFKPDNETQKPSYWKAIIRHLLFGFGLFYVDNRLKRKGIYPIMAITALIAYYLARVYYYDLAGYIFWGSSRIWLLSFVDVLLTCRHRRQAPSEPILKVMPKKCSYWKAMGWHLFLGFGLFYVDKRLKRKWIYVLSIVAILIGIGLAGTISAGIGFYGYDIDAQYFGTDIIGDSTATQIFYIGIIIYFVGFFDTLLTCRSYRHRT